MEKVMKHLPHGLLCAIIARILVTGPQLSDSIIVCALSALIYLLSNIKLNKETVAVQDEINKLRSEVEQYRKQSADAVSYVSAVKMSTQLRGAK